MYIEINLLPQDLRPRKKLISFDYRAVLVLFIIIAVAGLVSYYLMTVNDLKMQENELRTWNQAEKTLQKTVDLQNEVNRLRENVGSRVTIIKELTGDSDLRFSMLQHINTIIPQNLWLLRISEIEESNKIFFTIEGMSYSKQDISTFLASLEQYENFRNVSLESIRPAPLEVRDAYVYSVRIEPNFVQRTEEEEPAQRGSRRR